MFVHSASKLILDPQEIEVECWSRQAKKNQEREDKKEVVSALKTDTQKNRWDTLRILRVAYYVP